MKGAEGGCLSVCLILYESIVSYIHGSNHSKFSILVFNNHFYFEDAPKVDMKRQINMCPLMPMVFILIQIKFDIDTNSDELLETIRKHKKERKKLIITSSVRQQGAQIERKKFIITSSVQQHEAQIGTIISVEAAKVLGYVYESELSFTLFKT
jgi:hypothetical protein